MTKKTITHLVEAAYGNALAHGFWDDYDISKGILTEKGGISAGDKYTLDTKLHKIALVVSELGEAVEGVRKPAADEHCPSFTSEEIELADACIRIFDYAGAFGIRLEAAIEAKMEYNKSRPYKHGKGA